MNCCARWRRACPWWNVADLTARRKAKGLIGRTADALAYYPRERIAAALRSRFALRLHTSVLLLWTFSAGLLTTKGVYAWGLHSMFWRYTLAILVGYAAFLLGVRIWLAYVGVKTDAVGGDSNGRRQAQVDRSSSLDITDLLPSGRGGGSSPVFQGGGGGSGGGGASASFDAGAAAMPSNRYAPDISVASTAANVGGGGGGSSTSVGDALSGIGDLGGDDGCLIAFAIMIVVALIGLAIGGAVFLVTLGPEILIDAAFSAMLSGGLIKAGRKASDPDWLGSVFKGTWKPLAVVLALAWGFVALAAILTPQAHTFGAVWQIVWPQLLGAL